MTRHEESGESKQIHAEAYFVKAGIAIAEIEERLTTTPNQGELLITQVEDGRVLGNLSAGAYEILMYIKGKDRKAEDFKTWKRKRDYRHSTKRDENVPKMQKLDK